MTLQAAAGPWTRYADGDPVQDGEYLRFVRVPARIHRPAHTRYMHLEFAEGGFWMRGGQPKGLVLWFAPINAPPGQALVHELRASS